MLKRLICLLTGGHKWRLLYQGIEGEMWECRKCWKTK